MKKNKPVKHIGHVFRIQEIDVAKGNGAEMEGTLLLTVVVVVVIMNNADAGAGQFCRHIRSFYKPCSVQACVKWTVIKSDSRAAEWQTVHCYSLTLTLPLSRSETQTGVCGI